jgi:hypothetical protein
MLMMLLVAEAREGKDDRNAAAAAMTTRRRRRPRRCRMDCGAVGMMWEARGGKLGEEEEEKLKTTSLVCLT